MKILRQVFCLLFLLLATVVAPLPQAQANTAERFSVSGEVIDTWCYVTQIMFAEGSAHHQCAVWCAVGGIPVSILAPDGEVYVILKVEDDSHNVANPKLAKFSSHEVAVEGDLYKRDGVNYIVVNQIADDKGIVNLTHEEYGVQPFGE